MQLIYQEMQSNSADSQKMMKHYFDNNAKILKLKVEDTFMRMIPSLVNKEKKPALKPIFTGPYIVTQIDDKGNYTIKNLRGRESIATDQQLKSVLAKDFQVCVKRLIRMRSGDKYEVELTTGTKVLMSEKEVEEEILKKFKEKL